MWHPGKIVLAFAMGLMALITGMLSSGICFVVFVVIVIVWLFLASKGKAPYQGRKKRREKYHSQNRKDWRDSRFNVSGGYSGARVGGEKKSHRGGK